MEKFIVSTLPKSVAIAQIIVLLCVVSAKHPEFSYYLFLLVCAVTAIDIIFMIAVMVLTTDYGKSEQKPSRILVLYGFLAIIIALIILT